jgi:hypothetical protein
MATPFLLEFPNPVSVQIKTMYLHLRQGQHTSYSPPCLKIQTAASDWDRGPLLLFRLNYYASLPKYPRFVDPKSEPVPRSTDAAGPQVGRWWAKLESVDHACHQSMMTHRANDTGWRTHIAARLSPSIATQFRILLPPAHHLVADVLPLMSSRESAGDNDALSVVVVGFALLYFVCASHCRCITLVVAIWLQLGNRTWVGRHYTSTPPWCASRCSLTYAPQKVERQSMCTSRLLRRRPWRSSTRKYLEPLFQSINNFFRNKNNWWVANYSWVNM